MILAGTIYCTYGAVPTLVLLYGGAVPGVIVYVRYNFCIPDTQQLAMTTVVSVYMSPLAWSLLELGDKNLDVSIRAQELPF